MRYLWILILPLIFGCEGPGTFSHEHTEGSCVRFSGGGSSGGIYLPAGFVCYENYSESDCIFKNTSSSGYNWSDLTCEEFCEDTSETCQIYVGD